MLLPVKLASLRKMGAAAILCVAFATMLTGCATPTVTGFSDASKTLALAVKTGGTMAITPLATQPIWDDTNKVFIEAGAEEHPFKELEEQWQTRRKAMDAVLVYSASLEAISNAAANRKANAEGLAGSVGQLASSVPGYGSAAKAGAVVIKKGMEVVVEVKAWHDMRQAVEAADGAIQKLAPVIKENLETLGRQHSANVLVALAAHRKATFTLLTQEKTLLKNRDAQRAVVDATPGDATKGAELTRLETLLATVQVDANRARAEKARLRESQRIGKEFFESAAQGVEAWALSHAEIAKAFQENRTPNLGLLVARAEEIRAMVDEIKTNKEAK